MDHPVDADKCELRVRGTGQPYAFKQAGLLAGIVLLVGLTITVRWALSSTERRSNSETMQVDWTIRLIIVNSKLSGADSFQATMEHCFGKAGLIAISVCSAPLAFECTANENAACPVHFVSQFGLALLHTSLTAHLQSAFGGMLAFCVIVGDTIPHVLIAIFPRLPDTSVLWLFADRRFIIVIFILGISFPLSLYRDIAKVRPPNLDSMMPMCGSCVVSAC